MIVQVVVTNPEIQNFDEMMAHYQQELQQAGWAYNETKLSDEELEEFRKKSDAANRLTKNYERGIITGGEFDMKRLSGSY